MRSRWRQQFELVRRLGKSTHFISRKRHNYTRQTIRKNIPHMNALTEVEIVGKLSALAWLEHATSCHKDLRREILFCGAYRIFIATERHLDVGGVCSVA